jgi:hypothetical protein
MDFMGASGRDEWHHRVSGDAVKHWIALDIHGLLGSDAVPMLLALALGLLEVLTGLGCSLKLERLAPAADGCPRAAAIWVEADAASASLGPAPTSPWGSGLLNYIYSKPSVNGQPWR